MKFIFSAQIDYVIDAIDAVPQEMLDDQRVRIATGKYCVYSMNISRKYVQLFMVSRKT